MKNSKPLKLCPHCNTMKNQNHNCLEKSQNNKQWIDKWDAEIMWWFYDILEHELDVIMVHDSTELRKMLEEARKELDQQHQQELEELITDFQQIYGQFDSTTGVLNGYKTNEYGNNPVDILILQLREKVKSI